MCKKTNDQLRSLRNILQGMNYDIAEVNAKNNILTNNDIPEKTQISQLLYWNLHCKKVHFLQWLAIDGYHFEIKNYESFTNSFELLNKYEKEWFELFKNHNEAFKLSYNEAYEIILKLYYSLINKLN